MRQEETPKSIRELNVDNKSSQERKLTASEMYLFNRGELYHSYYKFGAHVIQEQGVWGTYFALWAPNARQVWVVGDFNGWDGRKHPMEKWVAHGIWTLFIPNLEEGELYKYKILTSEGQVQLKGDPYAFHAELRPQTASRIATLEGYSWGDQEWLTERKSREYSEEPMVIYELHLGSWRRKGDDFLSYKEVSSQLVDYVKKMGFTHIEILPLMEHPFDGSWGYQVTGYYACTSRYGTPQELMVLIDLCHQEGIGVILDWVPGHFCPDSHGLALFDGTALYETELHDHWGTYKFDFSRREVWSFLISNAIFWFDIFHVDGLRVDGVSSMLYLDYGKEDKTWQANEYGGRENLEAISFLQCLNQVVHSYYPEVLMIAEEATPWPGVTKPVSEGGLGFDYKWNMGWMNDTLQYISLDFSERRSFHQLLTFPMMYAHKESFILPLSHDEVVHGKRSLLNKMPGDYREKFAGLRALYSYFICYPGKKLLFMGGEIPQFIEWREDRELDWFLLDYELHRKFHSFVQKVNGLYLQERGLWVKDLGYSGFEWIDVHNHDQGIIIFSRKGLVPEDYIIVLINFLPNHYGNYRIGVRKAWSYEEILNSDALEYGGYGYINNGVLPVEDIPWHGRSHSIVLQVPPLATILLRPYQEQSKKVKIHKNNPRA